MTFLVSNLILQDAYREIKIIMTNQRNRLTIFSNKLTTEGADHSQVRGLYLDVRTARDRLNVLRLTPGLTTYAKNQENNPAYDVAAEFVASLNALEAIEDKVLLDLPKDTNGWLLGEKLDKTTGHSWRKFTPVQTTELKAVIEAFLATLS